MLDQMITAKPNLEAWGYCFAKEQAVINWLDTLRTNASTVPNEPLVDKCTEAMLAIENLVVALVGTRSQLRRAESKEEL